MKSFTPYPGRNYDVRDENYIMPEFSVHKKDGELVLEMNRANLPDLEISRDFTEIEVSVIRTILEKMAVFLILLFVVIIVSFNIFGSLTMLIIEKREDMATLSSLGAAPSMIRRIFVLEGWLISLAGLVAGLILGVGLSLLQQRLGIIKMPGSFLIDAYPVIINPLDIIFTCAGVALVGLTVALAASGKSKIPGKFVGNN